MPQVQVIQPIQQQPKRLRVAAYARVSSDSEDQLNSLAVQVDYYTHLIQENPNWEFAGIYTDEGITGTSTKRREQFNRLMDDCRAGLIDRVLVKSASRFARNTADALSSVRELKSLGVTVAFEKEGFDTETSNGEMLLSIICAVAQEESLSISQNMKWGIHKRMRTGNYITKFCSHSPSIPEEELHQAILKAVQNLAANFTDEVAAQLDGILRQMKAGENLKAQLQKQLEKAQQEFDRLLEMSLELDESTPFLDDKLRKLSGKIKILKANIAESTDGKGEDEEATKQLTAQDLLIKEYDDILTARIIEKVIVHSRQEIEIYFIGGYTQKIDLI